MRAERRPFPAKLHRAAGLTVAVAFVLAIAGCGSDFAQVSGVVTVDGLPLRGGNDVRATVFFQPTSGAGTAAVGLVDDGGNYNLSSGSKEGVAPGDYVVTITATQLVPSKDGGAARGRRITDRKYASAKTSGFQFTVQPGGNEFNLALNSPANTRPQGSR